MSRTRLAAAVLAVAGMVGTASIVHAQDQGQQRQGQQQDNGNNNNGGNNNGGGRRGGGNFDPAQMRQRMMDRIKEQLEVKDDEWAVMQPRLDKVMTLSFESRMGGMRGMFGRGGPGGDRGNRGGSQQNNSAVSKAQDDLRTALEDKGTSADTIAAKLKALRDARTQAKDELTKAQSDLKEILSQRQEAQLVMMGYLE
jgi:hypothetical protein